MATAVARDQSVIILARAAPFRLGDLEIEILKDAAAATYGSDAIAGVVNFITRTDQQGFLAARL